MTQEELDAKIKANNDANEAEHQKSAYVRSQTAPQSAASLNPMSNGMLYWQAPTFKASDMPSWSSPQPQQQQSSGGGGSVICTSYH
jgi:hypothetical protein